MGSFYAGMLALDTLPDKYYELWMLCINIYSRGHHRIGYLWTSCIQIHLAIVHLFVGSDCVFTID